MYCKPLSAGKQSEPRQVGRHIGRLLDALDFINSNRIDSHEEAITQDCDDFKYLIRRNLINEGWRIKVGPCGNKWKVLPPTT